MSQNRIAVKRNGHIDHAPIVDAQSDSQGAFAGAQYLMGLQIFVRLATFSMNILVIYIAGRKAFGVASIRFELLLSTILFLSREGMRNALLRVDTTISGRNKPAASAQKRPSSQEQHIINAALVPIAVGMMMASCLYWIYVGGSASMSEDFSFYQSSLTIYILAAWIELCVEPLYVLSRARVLFKLQAKCEAIAVTCRCVGVVATLLLGYYLTTDQSETNPLRLLAFSIGQLAYAIAIIISYAWYMSQELGYSIWLCYIPHKENGDGYISNAIGSLAATFVGQSLIKHLLTQGDSMVMARFATAEEMGTFALVSNYGSIPARVFFLPLEEASRAVFSKTAAANNTANLTISGSKSVKKDAQAQIHNARNVLTALGKLQFLLGLFLIVFGALYSPILAALARQSDVAVSRALAVYCAYLPFMGLNGFLEAFVHSVATKSQLIRINVWMAIFTVVYVLVAIEALWRFKLGSAGIIGANMLNMALRIIYCKMYISKWFANISGPRFREMLPHPVVIGMCAGSGAISIAMKTILSHLPSTPFHLSMLAIGGSLGIATLISVWIYEQPFIRSVRALRTGSLLHTKTE
ncbi:Oligosaccharide translocation protein rft1 [Coemansia brasiliensis]|uniref:Man(5)GlcNAc(2)-PP-dolichol translocation protein RFT1 n=1 Tax=Coemansia brasiliensis TaxID=2650707 RepID=A0A9W8I9J1_9FUNG|nr:Oligosaccharide translocation protein rft1 [Coemansia brasiliensis]